MVSPSSPLASDGKDQRARPADERWDPFDDLPELLLPGSNADFPTSPAAPPAPPSANVTSKD